MTPGKQKLTYGNYALSCDIRVMLLASLHPKTILNFAPRTHPEKCLSLCIAHSTQVQNIYPPFCWARRCKVQTKVQVQCAKCKAGIHFTCAHYSDVVISPVQTSTKGLRLLYSAGRLSDFTLTGARCESPRQCGGCTRVGRPV